MLKTLQSQQCCKTYCIYENIFVHAETSRENLTGDDGAIVKHSTESSSKPKVLNKISITFQIGFIIGGSCCRRPERPSLPPTPTKIIILPASVWGAQAPNFTGGMIEGQWYRLD